MPTFLQVPAWVARSLPHSSFSKKQLLGQTNPVLSNPHPLGQILHEGPSRTGRLKTQSPNSNLSSGQIGRIEKALQPGGSRVCWSVLGCGMGPLWRSTTGGNGLPRFANLHTTTSPSGDWMPLPPYEVDDGIVQRRIPPQRTIWKVYIPSNISILSCFLHPLPRRALPQIDIAHYQSMITNLTSTSQQTTPYLPFLPTYHFQNIPTLRL